MIALVLISYLVPLEEVERHTAGHRAFLALLHERGALIASGPFVPRTGGALLMRGDSREAIERALAGDPFLTEGVARHDVREWSPTLGRALFEA